MTLSPAPFALHQRTPQNAQNFPSLSLRSEGDVDDSPDVSRSFLKEKLRKNLDELGAIHTKLQRTLGRGTEVKSTQVDSASKSSVSSVLSSSLVAQSASSVSQPQTSPNPLNINHDQSTLDASQRQPSAPPLQNVPVHVHQEPSSIKSPEKFPSGSSVVKESANVIGAASNSVPKGRIVPGLPATSAAANSEPLDAAEIGDDSKLDLDIVSEASFGEDAGEELSNFIPRSLIDRSEYLRGGPDSGAMSPLSAILGFDPNRDELLFRRDSPDLKSSVFVAQAGVNERPRAELTVQSLRPAATQNASLPKARTFNFRDEAAVAVPSQLPNRFLPSESLQRAMEHVHSTHASLLTSPAVYL